MKSITKDHIGNTFSSKKEMCKHYNISTETFNNRIKLGWSLKDALTLPLKDYSCTDHLGNHFVSLKQMAKHYNIKYDAFLTRINYFNWPLEDALTIPVGSQRNKYKDNLGNAFPSKEKAISFYKLNSDRFDKLQKSGLSFAEIIDIMLEEKKNCFIQDHLGNKFSSFTEMCKFHNISHSTASRRLKAGWSLEDALTKPLTDYSVQDHLGNNFASKQEMCKHYNISWDVFKRRIKMGWSLEDALTKPLKDCSCQDHLGNTFPSILKMAEAYNTNRDLFQTRIDRGWSIEDALTLPPGEQPLSSKNKYTDNLGNSFSSQQKAISYYHLDCDRFKALKKEGYSFAEIVDIILKEKENRFVLDHLGNKFSSNVEMCKFYNVNIYLFYNRIESGFSLEEALHAQPKDYTCTDHLGNIFESTPKMCDFYNVDYYLFKRRVSQGWPIEKALTVKPSDFYSVGEILVEESLKERNVTYIRNKHIRKLLNIEEFKKLSADFYIPDVGIIEFDGQQHFIPWNHKKPEDTIKAFSKVKERDSMKTKLCRKYKIPLLRIRYDQIESLEELLNDFFENPDFYIKRNNKLLSDKKYWSIRKL